MILGRAVQKGCPGKEKRPEEKTLAQQVYESRIEAFVNGISLGGSLEVDAPRSYSVRRFKYGRWKP